MTSDVGKPARDGVTSGSQPDSSRLVQRNFNVAAQGYREAAAVCEVAQSRLLERLDIMHVQPRTIIELGCGDATALAALQERFPQAVVAGMDLSLGMLRSATSGRALASKRRAWQAAVRRIFRPRQSIPHRLAGDAHQLPFANHSADLILSNLMLPWCANPELVFREIARILRPGGGLLFTTAGPDTLLEYRQWWGQLDGYPHSFGLIDMHHLGDMLLAAGLQSPVMDRESLQVSYPDVQALQRELRAVGAQNIAIARRRGLMASGIEQALGSDLQKGIVTTLELVFGHAWQSARAVHNLPVNQQQGEQRIAFDDLREQLRNRSSGKQL